MYIDKENREKNNSKEKKANRTCIESYPSETKALYVICFFYIPDRLQRTVLMTETHYQGFL